MDRTVKMRVVAADPSVRRDGKILTAVVDVPAEQLSPGPRGYRVHVIDYDASSRRLFRPAVMSGERWLDDPQREVGNATILEDPRFHARNVYAVVMSTLQRFEQALGRRIGWGFDDKPGHQLKIAPHAFSDANAFYSRRDEALMFGYFPARDGRNVFTCLSHDVVVHETTHALLDGLRDRYTAPSSPDQAAFHEGFSDLVALLSVFAMKELVQHGMDQAPATASSRSKRNQPLSKAQTTYESLRQSMLFVVGNELGQEMSPIGRSALRHSLDLKPSPSHLKERVSAHDRGEVLVAAVMDAFIRVWAERMKAYFYDRNTAVADRERIAEEGSAAADYLLTMAVRALDYCPPVHLDFGTFLSAMVTADQQIRPNDPFRFRKHLIDAFRDFGIRPSSRGPGPAWNPFEPKHSISIERVRFDAMQHDLDEVFRFVWENRQALELFEGALTRVLSVRRCMRIAPEDGFPLRETVAEVLQQVRVPASELHEWGVKCPRGLPPSTQLMLFGGVTLVFDDFGRLKFSIGSSVLNKNNPAVGERQSAHLQSLWERGAIRMGRVSSRPPSAVHRLRSAATPHHNIEPW